MIMFTGCNSIGPGGDRLVRLPTSSAIRNFSRREDGTLLIFGVYVFVLILMVAGIGIDLMRFERDRTELQYTLDRAVLAAADLDQTLDPSSVVSDYFDKSHLGSYLSSVSVSEGLGYRTVTANAKATVATQFMHMTGLNSLTAPAASTAEERIDEVEISLVLDVSGSMNSNSRLTNLKVAAKQFVDTMVDNTEDGKMSISIIPYATQVSLPDELMNQFNVGNEQTYSNCINFEASDFNSTSVSTTSPMKRTMHFDPWYTADRRNSGSELPLPVCEADARREMLLFQKDRATLKTYIDNLSARGNTSIDVGMKWGTALLDPSMRPVLNTLIGDGLVPAEFAPRPYNFDQQDVLKVVVLMTDGQNTSQYYINDPYRQGPSDIWYNANKDRYSVYYAGSDSYYWPFSDSWEDHPYGNGSGESGSAVQLDYGDLWARTTLQYNVRKHYLPWMSSGDAWNQWYYSVRNYVNSTEKNNRAYDICDAAKAEGIIVFTIGFEAPYSGRQVLRNCASSDAHFFDVDGLEISDAFASIATSIRKLRLTQ